MPVNLEDLDVNFGLQHFKLGTKAMKKLTPNLIQED